MSHVLSGWGGKVPGVFVHVVDVFVVVVVLMVLAAAGEGRVPVWREVVVVMVVAVVAC